MSGILEMSLNDLVKKFVMKDSEIISELSFAQDDTIPQERKPVKAIQKEKVFTYTYESVKKTAREISKKKYLTETKRPSSKPSS